jgi:hypothetical protein
MIEGYNNLYIKKRNINLLLISVLLISSCVDIARIPTHSYIYSYIYSYILNRSSSAAVKVKK